MVDGLQRKMKEFYQENGVLRFQVMSEFMEFINPFVYLFIPQGHRVIVSGLRNKS